MSEGTVLILAPSFLHADEWLQARGYRHGVRGWTKPDDPKRYIYLQGWRSLSGLRSPKVYVLPGGRSRADEREISRELAATAARLVFYP